MAQFASDSFAGTSGVTLTAYSANWVKHSLSGTSTLIISDAGRVRMAASLPDDAIYYHTGVPASADYTVKADLVPLSTDDGAIMVCGRMSTSANTFYAFRYAKDSGVPLAAWQLYKRVAGSFTQLGSNVGQSLSNGVTYEVKLRMSGSTIEGYKEGSGTPTISTTDTSITAAGKSGLRTTGYISTNSTSHHIDNFSADDIVASTTSFPAFRSFPRAILNF